MQAVATQVSTKYQVVIPKLVREALGIQPHDSLLFVISGDTVSVRPQPASLTAALRGLHAELWPDPAAWLEEERSAWE
jgi:AbrB family looped-hinge helix DNA binding protein